jgi:hypothetical protein
MPEHRRRLPTALTLAIGILMGWALAGHRPSTVRAGGGDRYGDDSLTTGPVALQYNERTRTQANQDALYFLDYKAARLVATIPAQRQSIQGTQIIDNFTDRDLIADFRLDAESGPRPHFLMTPGSLGAYGEGWAPLFVFESTSRQVAVYKLQVQAGAVKTAKFELLELKSFAQLPALPTGQ